MTDPKAFFNKADFWDVPADPATQANSAINSATTSTINPNATGPAQPPYYAVLQLPGVNGKPSFSLTSSFVARGNTNLAAFAAVSSDPGTYGQIRVLQVPRNTVINGPGQVASLYEARQEISSALSLLRQGGSRVVLGNLLTLPVGGGLLYLEPVYTQASSGLQYPLLQDVIVSFGDKIVFQPTLSAALDALFGKGASSVLPSPGPSASPVPTAPGSDLAAAIAEADAAFRAGEAALKNGDFAAYGDAQKRLGAALARAAALSGKSGASPSPSPSPSPR